jgi:pSer/pThr/pTyr-binding forkhead associated (FHA) protein/tRNA A-37 threonylcarbamoyl transferase component Bud32
MAGEQLRVTEGVERGKSLTLDGDLLIGRAAPEDEGKLGGDPEISRVHARVSRGPGGELTIEDLGSSNGTFVNGEQITGTRTLAAGDVVRVGRTTLEVTGEPAAAPRAADVELVITGGHGVGRRLTLRDELVIGRAVEGDGKLADDPELSRRHARIFRDPSGRLTIEDFGSANGTFVNEERVSAQRALQPGDSVRVGSTTLRIAGAGQAPVPAPPRPRPVAPPTPPPDELASALPVGSVFAGCRVEEVIGHGDMGVVYRAEELALQRQLALKVIRPDYSRDERFRERFRRESRIAAAIDHPNVIPIFDAGEENGVLYISMRLVEGTNLRALIAANGHLDPLRAARIVRQVGAALDAAHARGMLHRDVKPSNVLLGREDHAYLTDFGLAKPAASSDGLTRHGTVVARAEYVAPEQLMGQRVDARADTYALGCVLFEALTGSPPTDRSAYLAPELDAVVSRAMAGDPDERYPSSGDLGEAALVAAGGLRRARPESIVARGDAAFSAAAFAAAEPAKEPAAAAAEPEAAAVAEPTTGTPVQWAIALVALALVAVGMVAALHGISTL